MKDLRNHLELEGYVESDGVFRRRDRSECESRIDDVWTGAAATHGLKQAAAATDSKDPFAKYPRLVWNEVRVMHGTVLDAGCGHGRIALPLLRNNSELGIVGADASEGMLKGFAQELRADEDASLKRRALLVKTGLDGIPFPDGSFDCIYSVAVLLHNPYSHVPAIIREFWRLLKAGGKLIIASSFVNALNAEGIQGCFYARLPWRAMKHGPVRPYSRRRVLRLFANWTNVRVVPTGTVVIPRSIFRFRLPFGGQIRAANRWFDGLLRGGEHHTRLFAKHFDVLAQK